MSENARPTVAEVYKSLNHYDETGIEKAFGQGLDELPERGLVRALIFVVKRREGLGFKEASDYAFGLPMADLSSHFEADEPDLGDDVEPASEQGKEPAASA